MNALSDSIEHIIRELVLRSSSFNTNDVLVNCDDAHKKVVPFYNKPLPSSDVPVALLKEARQSIRESGINPLCVSQGIVHLSVNGKNVRTPVILFPVSVQEDKIKKTVAFQADDEQRFVNPFLLRFLEREFDLIIADVDIDSLPEELIKSGLELEPDQSFVANFHHHRYAIIKELEILLKKDKYSNALTSLFGLDHSSIPIETALNSARLFPADVDHERVFSAIEHSNLVIQGPPGTGKSQVISNLIGKFLATQQNMVIVSEKHVALEVIKNKLSQFGLDHFCYIAASNHVNSSFIRSLRECWDFIEDYNHQTVNNIMISEQLEDQLQMTLDLLNVKDLIGGVSFTEFMDHFRSLPDRQIIYSSAVPEMSNFLANQDLIQKIYHDGLSEALGKMKPALLESEDLGSLDQKISGWIARLHQLKETFGCNNLRGLYDAMKKASRYQIYENDVFKRYSSIFEPGSPKQKKFLRLYKKYTRYKTVGTKVVRSSHWKIEPSITELDALEKQIFSGGIISKFKAKKRWKNLSYLPVENFSDAIKEERLIHEQINVFSQIILDFCDLGIENPESEVGLIHHTIAQYSEQEWKKIHNVNAEDRGRYTSFHKLLNQITHDLKAHFNFNEEDDLINSLTVILENLGEIIRQREQFSKLDKNTLDCLSRNGNYSEFEQQVIFSHFVIFSQRFPEFSSFNISDLCARVERILSLNENEASLFSTEIKNAIASRFSDYHDLLSTPARKLTDEQKELKKRLRKGKSILVREFGKTRSHMSLHELYASEAVEWIKVLKPVWLSNPSQIANSFPMRDEIFDVAVFDEASQIPLQNAIGTVQRSKRVIVAGDEHQMGPSSYFSSIDSNSTDLLHQASFYYPKIALQHHYRSEHPDLISFSNQHFYNNSLRVYPSKTRKHPPIVHHFIEDGKFVERSNQKEAIAVARHIELLIDTTETMGIVAFSEEQLNCIYRELSESVKSKLEERIDNATLFFKALENVQGDECDLLIISFGYGKDDNGEFSLRFGPMNTENGRKRLNVLSTRAIKQIDLFCSVTSSDFKISDNESVNLLRKWIQYFERYQEKDTIEFPFGLKPEIKSNVLYFKNIHEYLVNARELATLHGALVSRGWKVAYM